MESGHRPRGWVGEAFVMRTPRKFDQSGSGREISRAELFARARSSAEPFDLLIVGGGATGLGAAVDAAARGYRVCLVERDDFAKGTSSRSTKLVHGGVRYLKQGNIALVRDALRERSRLARNAPHLVRETGFLIPNHRWWERVMYGVGLKFYDMLAGAANFNRSRWLSRDESLALVPEVASTELCGGVLYFDGQFDDARLAINLAQTAVDLGAVILNYCACVRLLKKGGRVVGAVVSDAETGDEFEIRARAVINATGVFVDGVRSLDEPGVAPLVAASRGIHLVVAKEFLAGDTALMVPKTADGRVFFAVPWHDRVVLGTTDVPTTRIDAEPRASREEIDFILEHAGRYLAKKPTQADVLSVFAGLRPLVKAGSGSSTASLSRDHTIVVSRSGLVSITGGKWTTYRKMAADVIDQAATVAGLPRVACATAELSLRGASLASTRSDAAAKDATRYALYGADAAGIDELARSDVALDSLLHPALPYRKAEVIWHVRCEMARTVEDVLARRTRALLLDAKASIAAAPAVAQLLAGEFGLGAEWQQQQVDHYTALARGYVLAAPATPRTCPA